MRPRERRELKAETLAQAGGKDHDRISSLEGCMDGVLLPGSELREAELRLQDCLQLPIADHLSN